ncbi:MARVEL domain-containing protein 3 [Varanus komodoensis]|nr:MARVEL domain-containing protein 3 [Varanus komodoensis]
MNFLTLLPFCALALLSVSSPWSPPGGQGVCLDLLKEFKTQSPTPSDSLAQPDILCSQKMSHLERPHRDKDYRHRESPLRYSDGRSGKPYPPDGRLKRPVPSVSPHMASSANWPPTLWPYAAVTLTWLYPSCNERPKTEHSTPVAGRCQENLNIQDLMQTLTQATKEQHTHPNFILPKGPFLKNAQTCAQEEKTDATGRTSVSFLPPASTSNLRNAEAVSGEDLEASLPLLAFLPPGILQLVEIIVNIMVLICIAATQASLSGFSSFGAFGSFSLNSIYSPFEGTELQEVRDLDMQYNQMRAPGVYGGVAFSLTMMCLTLLFLVGGAKPLHRLSAKLLFMECLFDTLACLGYITAVGLYLHFVMQVNATEVCKRRERLYARQGYTSMNCIVQGGDAAVALFGLLAACLYCASTVVCALTLRSKRELRRQEAKMQYSLAGTGSAGDPRRAPESLDGRNQVPRAFATLV